MLFEKIENDVDFAAVNNAELYRISILMLASSHYFDAILLDKGSDLNGDFIIFSGEPDDVHKYARLPYLNESLKPLRMAGDIYKAYLRTKTYCTHIVKMENHLQAILED